MRTVRDSGVPGYVVVSSGITTDPDSPTLFDDIQAWVDWRQAFDAYALVPVPGEMVQADEILMPGAIYHRKAWWAFLWTWRLRSWLLNTVRRRLVAEFAAKEAIYFSKQVADARARGNAQ